jgi:predicted permease
MNLTIDGNAEVVQGELVSGDYYEQMQVKPQLGRAIEPYDDEKPGGSPVVVISDGFWARRFDRSPSVIGRTVLLNLTSVTIVGVNPPRFTGAKSVQTSPEIFAPFSMQPLVAPNGSFGNLLSNTKLWWTQIMARPKPGVPSALAAAELDVALKNAVRSTMNPKAGEALPDLRIHEGSRGLNESSRMFAKPIVVLTVLDGIVLLLACANIANLLLARSASRQREMSVRIALGATRARVLRQVLTESLLLSAMGGLGGLLVGFLGRNAIPRLVSNSWEPAITITSFDWRVFLFAAGLALITGLLCGFIPAWQATRTQVNTGLKDTAQTSTRRRKGLAGKTIVGFQIALSTLLVIGAALFLRSLINLGSIDPGFDPHNLVLFEIQPPQSRYHTAESNNLFRQIEERVASVPGVESVSAASIALLSNSTSNSDFIPAGQQSAPEKELLADNNAVGDRYFETMRIPIVTGRAFQPTDTETSLKVAVVNRALVKQFFPNQNPIGKTFSTDEIDAHDGKKLVYQIVGVCADARYATLREDPPPIFYVSYRQAPDLTWGMTYAVKSRMQRSEIANSLKQAVQSIDRDLPLTDVRTQQEQIDALLQQERIFASLTAGFGILALILAIIGIYGIMSYSVARRTNEIGIRLALGARTRQVLTMVLAETSWLAIAGVVIGSGTALLLVRYIRSMLYGLRNFDPVSLILAAGLLLGVSLLAGFVPARRAARVQPMEALRHE